jgi:hypothetical protein
MFGMQTIGARLRHFTTLHIRAHCENRHDCITRIYRFRRVRPKEYGDCATNHDEQRRNHISACQRFAETRGREQGIGHEIDRVQWSDMNKTSANDPLSHE